MDLLKGISFKIEPGEKVAILGSMGSGKTSLLRLIMGFYPPETGAIRIDGTDIGQIDPADLRRSIGYVPQEPRLFYGTVRDNIAIKAPWSDDALILHAAKMSGANAFIERHPAGYDMPIGEGGQGLSGGQCQSITIARAMLNSPSMLLFDEPTSCMDKGAEKLLVKNLRAYCGESTVILVTHRISVLQAIDRIIVLQAGRIIADGDKKRVLDALKHLHQEQT